MSIPGTHTYSFLFFFFITDKDHVHIMHNEWNAVKMLFLVHKGFLFASEKYIFTMKLFVGAN